MVFIINPSGKVTNEAFIEKKKTKSNIKSHRIKTRKVSAVNGIIRFSISC